MASSPFVEERAIWFGILKVPLREHCKFEPLNQALVLRSTNALGCAIDSFQLICH